MLIYERRESGFQVVSNFSRVFSIEDSGPPSFNFPFIAASSSTLIQHYLDICHIFTCSCSSRNVSEKLLRSNTSACMRTASERICMNKFASSFSLTSSLFSSLIFQQLIYYLLKFLLFSSSVRVCKLHFKAHNRGIVWFLFLYFLFFSVHNTKKSKRTSANSLKAVHKC